MYASALAVFQRIARMHSSFCKLDMSHMARKGRSMNLRAPLPGMALFGLHGALYSATQLEGSAGWDGSAHCCQPCAPYDRWCTLARVLSSLSKAMPRLPWHVAWLPWHPVLLWHARLVGAMQRPPPTCLAREALVLPGGALVRSAAQARGPGPSMQSHSCLAVKEPKLALREGQASASQVSPPVELPGDGLARRLCQLLGCAAAHRVHERHRSLSTCLANVLLQQSQPAAMQPLGSVGRPPLGRAVSTAPSPVCTALWCLCKAVL